MEYQVVIYSADAVFARMLELEFSMRGMSVCVAEQPRGDLYADVVLLDLDSAQVPAQSNYHRMIGFTRGLAMTEDETQRLCTMILHRPFDMRLLRREVLQEKEQGSDAALFPATVERQGTKPSDMIQLDQAANVLHINGYALTLTPKEAAVAACLLENRGTVVPRSVIAEAIGGSAANKTDVYVCYLRQKLETVTNIKLIKTVRGKGYLLVC